MCTLLNKAGYGRWRMGDSFMQSLTLKLISSVSLPLFQGFEGDVFFRPSPHANLKGHGPRTTATTKMQLFDQVTFCLGIFERKTVLLVVETKAFYRV